MLTNTSQRVGFLGFSLVELLVAISVVTALAMLALPILGEAKSQSHRAACTSNLRSIGNAFSLYVQDAGNYPRTYGQWYPLLLPYLDVDASKDINLTRPKVLRCPANHQHQWNSQKLSYGYNSFLGNNYSSTTNVVSLRPTSFSRPSQVILCGDVDNRLPAPNAVINYNRTTGSPPGITHKGQANLLFVDGHVELKKPADVTSDAGRYTTPILRMWGMYGNFTE